MRGLGVLACAVLLAACGSSGKAGGEDATASASMTTTPSSTAAPAADAAAWPRFGFDAARTSDARAGISAARVRGLRARTVELPGTVDSAPILAGGLLVMTTTYGRTVALDPADGRIRWTFTPASYPGLAGTAQITTATPVADPGGGTVYAASPDGRVHKLRLSDGHELTGGGWPASVTRDATHEKIASALNVQGADVLVTTGGYIGDAPPYQGKVVAIDRASGRLVHVFNSLCANRRAIIVPRTCGASDSAIWARAGAVVDPHTGRVYVATSNGPFDGRANWGDSVLELTRGAGRLLRHYTPRNQRALEAADADLGSAAPALLPDPRTGRTRYLLQGGKDSTLRLLDLSRSLSGTSGAAGRRLGGEVQSLPLQGSGVLVSAIAVRHRAGSTMAFVGTAGATSAYTLRNGRLRLAWSHPTGATSPLLAGSLLWAYDLHGGLNVYRATSGRLVRRLPAPGGHWNSPIVAGGRAYLPSGDANDHATRGRLTIYG